MPEQQRDEALEANDKAGVGKPVAPPPERPATEGGKPTDPDRAITAPEVPAQLHGKRERATAEDETKPVASDARAEAARVTRAEPLPTQPGAGSSSRVPPDVTVQSHDGVLSVETEHAQVRVGPPLVPLPPPTGVQKLLVSFWLIFLVVLVVFLTFRSIYQLNKDITNEIRVGWNKPPGVKLRSGPVAFRYDDVTKQLIHRGEIGETEKALLVSLVEPRNEDYESAIDGLAFSSRDKSEYVLLYVLFLGGFGSVIGVVIRSASNFLGVACYHQDFVFGRWWPWYLVRPFLAFLVGVLIVILIKSDLMTSSQRAGSDGSLWWVGLTALAGFGLEDSLDRLRVLSKTLFATDRSGTVQVTAKDPAAVQKTTAAAPQETPAHPVPPTS